MAAAFSDAFQRLREAVDRRHHREQPHDQGQEHYHQHGPERLPSEVEKASLEPGRHGVESFKEVKDEPISIVRNSNRRSTHFLDPAVLYVEPHVRRLGDRLIMGHDDDGLVVIVRQAAQQVHDFLPGTGI